MSVESAQEMLGLDPAKNPPVGSRAEAAWSGLFTHGENAGEVCDACAFFGDETNRCGVTQAEATFDSPACRFLRARRVESK